MNPIYLPGRRLWPNPGLRPIKEVWLDHLWIKHGEHSWIPQPVPDPVGLTHVPKDWRTVVVRPVQDPPQLLKGINPLYALRVAFSCEAECCILASTQDCGVPPPPPYLRVPVAPLRPLVFEYPPRRHVHIAQVTAEKRLLTLLYHLYPSE